MVEYIASSVDPGISCFSNLPGMAKDSPSRLSPGVSCGLLWDGDDESRLNDLEAIEVWLDRRLGANEGRQMFVGCLSVFGRLVI